MATKIRGRQIETDDFIKSVRNSDLDWTNDVNTASQKAIAQYVASAAGSGGVFVCTFNGSTMDKTPQEIYEAYQDGKFVVCVATPYYLKLTYITPQSSSYLIHFESIHLAGYGNYEIRYISYNTSTWLSSTDSIQQGLVSGTNIKTINGNSLLGSGNITIDSDIFSCTFTLTSGITGTIDKTASEILQAANANKSVLCIYGNEIYFLVSKNVLTFSRIIGNSCKYISYNQSGDNWMIITTNLQTSLVSGTTIKTINGNSVLGSGNIDTDSWHTIVADDGDTSLTITPTTTHTTYFVDNSGNTSDLTVTIENTGIDIVFEEYETLIVKAGSTCRFDVKKFTDNNTVYASVKRTNLQNAEPSYYGVTSFRADNVQRVMNYCGFTTIEQYRQALETLPSTFLRPSIYTKTGTTTFNNENYYVYSLQDWANDHYAVISDYIVLIPFDFAFKSSHTIENCGEKPLSTYLQYYYLTADHMEIYKGSDNAPTFDTRNVIDFVP